MRGGLENKMEKWEEKKLKDMLKNAAEEAEHMGVYLELRMKQKVCEERDLKKEKRDEKDADMMNAGWMNLSVSGSLA